jgi:hypothetical protein
VSFISARKLLKNIFCVNNDTFFIYQILLKEQYQEKWLQHEQRMDTNRIQKQALQYKPKGRWDIGQPRKRWRDQLHLEDQGTGNMMKPNMNLMMMMMMMMMMLKAEFVEQLIIGKPLYIISGKEDISVFLWKLKQY